MTLPLDLALQESDRKLALAGVTTMFHSISFGAFQGLRSNEAAAAMVNAITAFARRPTLVRHRVHLRFEISNWEALPLAEELIAAGAVQLLSFMDHTPGQGQYREPYSFREYVRKMYHASETEIDRIIAEKIAGRARVTDADLLRLAAVAREHGAAIAGHDPDTLAAVDASAARGASIVEFPITLDAAHYARQHGIHVLVGAPNVLNAGSHAGNLSAIHAIAAGAASVLCSDYYPSGLLQAIFALVARQLLSVPAAVAMATAQPAAAAGLPLGRIEPGAPADLLLVSDATGRPAVGATIVGGRLVCTAGQFAGSAAAVAAAD